MPADANIAGALQAGKRENLYTKFTAPGVIKAEYDAKAGEFLGEGFAAIGQVALQAFALDTQLKTTEAQLAQSKSVTALNNAKLGEMKGEALKDYNHWASKNKEAAKKITEQMFLKARGFQVAADIATNAPSKKGFLSGIFSGSKDDSALVSTDGASSTGLSDAEILSQIPDYTPEQRAAYGSSSALVATNQGSIQTRFISSIPRDGNNVPIIDQLENPSQYIVASSLEQNGENAGVIVDVDGVAHVRYTAQVPKLDSNTGEVIKETVTLDNGDKEEKIVFEEQSVDFLASTYKNRESNVFGEVTSTTFVTADAELSKQSDDFKRLISNKTTPIKITSKEDVNLLKQGIISQYGGKQTKIKAIERSIKTIPGNENFTFDTDGSGNVSNEELGNQYLAWKNSTKVSQADYDRGLINIKVNQEKKLAAARKRAGLRGDGDGERKEVKINQDIIREEARIISDNISSESADQFESGDYGFGKDDTVTIDKENNTVTFNEKINVPESQSINNLTDKGLTREQAKEAKANGFYYQEAKTFDLNSKKDYKALLKRKFTNEYTTSDSVDINILVNDEVDKIFIPKEIIALENEKKLTPKIFMSKVKGIAPDFDLNNVEDIKSLPQDLIKLAFKMAAIQRNN